MNPKIFNFIVFIIGVTAPFIHLGSAIGSSNKISQSLKNEIMNITLYDTVRMIQVENKSYLVSVADVELKSNSPQDRMNARALASEIALTALSKFVNSEDVATSEVLKTIRVVKRDGSSKCLVQDEEEYVEKIKLYSSGPITGLKNICWKETEVYYCAAMLEFTE